MSVVKAPGAGAYPISSFTWLIVYKQQTDAVKGRALADFVRWALTEGEKSAATLDYGPLPAAMARQLLRQVGAMALAAR